MIHRPGPDDVQQPRLHLGQVGLVGVQGDQDGAQVGRQVGGVEFVGQGQRGLAGGHRLPVAIRVRQRLDLGHQGLQPGAIGESGGEPDRLLGALQQVGRLVVDPGQGYIAGEQPRPGGTPLVAVGQPIGDQVDAAADVAAGRRRQGRLCGGVVAARVVLGHPAQHLLEQPGRLPRAAQRQRRLAGRDPGGDRGVGVPAGGRVPGQIGRRAQFGPGRQRRREGGVQSAALARQQVVADRLGHQGVPERVGLPGHRLQGVVVDRCGQRGVQFVGGEVDHGLQQVVAQPAPHHRRGPHHPLRRRVELLEPRSQHPLQVGAEHVAAGDQFLGEEGVPGGPFDDRGHPLVAGVGEGAHQRPHVGAGQRIEMHPGDVGQPGPDAQRGVQRVAPVQVVGAIADHQPDRCRETPGHQQGEQVARGVIGPVGVLDHDQDAAPVGHPAERGVHSLGQQSRTGGGPHLGARRRAGEQLGQGGMSVGDLADQLGSGLVQGADQLGERQVGQIGAGLGDAMADRNQTAGRLGVADHVAQQPGLADAGVTGQHDHAATAVGESEGTDDAVEFVGPSHHSPGLAHGVDYPQRLSRRRDGRAGHAALRSCSRRRRTSRMISSDERRRWRAGIRPAASRRSSRASSWAWKSASSGSMVLTSLSSSVTPESVAEVGPDIGRSR